MATTRCGTAKAHRRANDAFAAIMARYVSFDDEHVAETMQATERRNLEWFGYGAKGMALSMGETAIAVSDSRISATDIHRLVELGKSVLQHPVELPPGIREAVKAVATNYPIVLITKGDLFHQEKKVAECGLAKLFRRIEIVSEKNAVTYQRVLGEFDLPPAQFAMIGNSLRSDMEPVLRLGGWGIHVPCHATWEHEMENGPADDEQRMLTVQTPAAIPVAVARLDALSRAWRHKWPVRASWFPIPPPYPARRRWTRRPLAGA